MITSHEIEKELLENQRKEELIEAINYFSFKYPMYKFITEESVKKICDKYGLIYGSISKYIGEVPEKNLQHMEEFKISEIDCAYLEGGWTFGRECFVNYEQYKRNEEYRMNGHHHIMSWYTKAGLEICANVENFNTERSEIKNKKLIVKDPIVLQPVMYKNTKHYLVVTAWGKEGEDVDVINPINN